jgi:xanthine dehydrogenase molybdenum-binding subunit
MTTQRRYIGQSVPRLDGIEKVTGRARYAPDLRLPGMLFGKVVRSPHPHAVVRAVRAEKALSIPGVRAIVTCHDVPRVIAWMPEGREENLAVKDGRVRFIGEPVAAIAAVDEDLAEEAASLVEVDYEPLSAVFDPEEALKREAPSLYEGGNVKAVIPIAFGDVDAAFAEADFIFEHRYTTSKVKQCSLEPVGTCLADYSPSGKLTLWSSTQRPYEAKFVLAKVLGIPASKVRVIKPFTGGAFGCREGLIQGLEVMCSELARKTGRPVRVSFSREEDFLGSESRHPSILHLRTGVRRDGTFCARELKVLMDAGAYASHSLGVTAFLGVCFLRAYRCSNAKFEGTIVHTNTPPSGAFRGFGNPQANFAVESQIDEIARALGMDPLALRLKNVPRKIDTDPFFRIPFHDVTVEECLRLGAERVGWEARARPAREGTKARGVGVACALHVSGTKGLIPNAASAIVKLNADGSVHLLTSAADEGQGSLTVFAQIVADTLGAAIEDVSVTGPDTDVTPYDTGTYGSRQAFVGGSAVREAALKARAMLLEEAGKRLEAPPDELELQGGRAYVTASPERFIPVPDLLMDVLFGAQPRQIIGVASGEAQTSPTSCAAQFVEVEVDTETGMVRVLKVVAVHDVGRVLHPGNVEGQIYGGIQQGIGYALTEQMLLDRGKVLNPGFDKYKMLSASDMPEVEIILYQDAVPAGSFGVKGVGEIPLVPTAAAVANAIFDAIGVRIRDLPLLQEKIHAALAAGSDAPPKQLVR